MPDAAARISVAITAQVRQDGAFPSVTTYPASVERYLAGGTITKVFAATGTIGATAATLPVAATLVTVKLWYVENTGSLPGTTSNVVVADAPVNGTVPRGQIVLATNDSAGWPAGTVTLTGTAGATFKVIALGT